MDIKGTEDKLNQVDSLLTTLTKILKKHWLILILIGVATSVYFSWDYIISEPIEEEIQTEEVQPEVVYIYDDTTTTYDDTEEQPVEEQPVEPENTEGY